MKFTWLYIFIFIVAASISAQETHIIDWKSGSKSLQSTLEVEVGDTVQWVFGESLPQNVINTSFGTPSSFGLRKFQTKGSIYEYVFDKKGIYTFESSSKKGLKGAIKVTDSKSFFTKDKEGYKIYPNPVKDRIFFENPAESDPLEITFYDVLGKQVKRNLMSSSMAQNGMDVSELKRGVYLVQIDNGIRSFTQKLVKN
ncbi:T9SS type A sorting domain-containing protein [Leeuwenhoekiella aequorea]|jgi:plastocyanin|uniref:Putative secreted protein (Por secretion system target) n=1 Tax=Leeuwenhoekiella aequorea TaxID=283736 RepID=A0A4Q0PAD1_9FLAO|nr:T9SS type A sorting domain-containing protein [Leeuwenhoekiella aequorea]RXG23790.1 putative secreted protein (Por secretion system target) [Leeuwenhoekiella aequorea]|tara:strand:- start:293 stop:886 length:594 start_codon:yes stop_codon:yes gene_type:complete